MEKVSWFKLMWGNSYIQLFAVGLIGTILMCHYHDSFDSFGEWAMGTSILVLMCLAIAYFGFYKFWKSYNAEADRINANKKQREEEEVVKASKIAQMKENSLISICSFHQDYQVPLINQWCPYCGRVIAEPIIIDSIEELKERARLFNEHCAEYVDAKTKVGYYESLSQLPDGIDLDSIKRKVSNYQFGWKAEAEYRQ
jgi:hypothetical protein